METEIELQELVNQLKSAIMSPGFSRKEAISAMYNLISWLTKPENNTDSNCRFVDSFVAYEISPNPENKGIPEDVYTILFDMGATLHDTHTSPEIAENFDSTPALLLERIKKLKP
jgi:hypothetical protein